MENLTRDHRSIWCEINVALLQQDAVGSALPLRCRAHNQQVRVTSSADLNFAQVRVRGCPLVNCRGNTKLAACGTIVVVEQPLNKHPVQQTREFHNSKLTSAKVVDYFAPVKAQVKSLQPTNDEAVREKNESNALVGAMSSLNVQVGEDGSSSSKQMINRVGPSVRIPERRVPDTTPTKSTMLVTPLKMKHIFAPDYGLPATVQSKPPSFSSLSPSNQVVSNASRTNKPLSFPSSSRSNQATTNALTTNKTSLANDLFHIRPMPRKDYDESGHAPKLEDKENEFRERLERIERAMQYSLQHHQDGINGAQCVKSVRGNASSESYQRKDVSHLQFPTRNYDENSLASALKIIREIKDTKGKEEQEMNETQSTSSGNNVSNPLTRTMAWRQDCVAKFLYQDLNTARPIADYKIGVRESSYDNLVRRNRAQATASVTQGRTEGSKQLVQGDVRDVDGLQRKRLQTQSSVDHKQEYMKGVERNLASLRSKAADARNKTYQMSAADYEEVPLERNKPALQMKNREDEIERLRAEATSRRDRAQELHNISNMTSYVRPPVTVHRPNTGAIPTHDFAIQGSHIETLAFAGTSPTQQTVQIETADDALLGEHRRQQPNVEQSTKKKKNCCVM